MQNVLLHSRKINFIHLFSVFCYVVFSFSFSSLTLVVRFGLLLLLIASWWSLLRIFLGLPVPRELQRERDREKKKKKMC